jgi:dienelactone hydrolase
LNILPAIIHRQCASISRTAVGATAICLVLGLASAVRAAGTNSVNWVPADLLPPAPTNGPALCRGNYLTPEQGQAVLAAALNQFPDRATWDAYANHLRERIQEGAGLAPWPKRIPLHPLLRHRRVHDGYSVENVALQTVPGFWATGNLYRPLATNGSFPVILSTHGHSKDPQARLAANMQQRCGTLARMGAAVFAIDMFGYGDTIPQVGANAHAHPFSMTIQTWNNMRALDFLLSLDGADPKRVGVTGESGGGTQTFILTALDPRVTLCVPVVMVSSYFFGGCLCESGLPIHRSADHFADNAMIAALAAPRPMLVISDGKDWTQHVPEIEYPFLQKIYGYYGAAQNIQNTHLALEGHDYGPSKRAAMYHFLAEHFGLDLRAALDADGKIDESKIAIEPADALHVFDDADPAPAPRARDAADVESALQALQKG